MSNLDAVVQCPFIMSSTAEQHSYTFLTLTLKSSFIAACNDMNFFSWASNLYWIFLHSYTIQRLNSLVSRRPHSIFWKHQFKTEILISFCSFKSWQHCISLFSCNIWCGRKKVPTLCRFKQSEKSCTSNYTNAIKISDCLRVILILFIY